MNNNDIDALQLIESLQQGVIVHSPTTEIIYANPKALELMRQTMEQALGKDDRDPKWRFIDKHHKLMPLEDFPVNQVLSKKQAVANIEIGVCDSTTDKTTWVLCNAFPQLTASGEIKQVVVCFLDITDKKAEIPFEAIVSHANDAILVTEAAPIEGTGPRIVYANHAFCALTGYTVDELIGQTPRLLQGADTSRESRARIREALAAEQPIRETLLNYSKAGKPYWLELNIFPLINSLGSVSYYAAVQRDVTKQVKKEYKLKDLAITDPLTTLLNRRGFFEQAGQKLAAQVTPSTSSLAMIDIDFFKLINDSFGHDKGDAVIKQMGNALQRSFRDSDIVCRFGGEEFIVLLLGATLDISRQKLDAFRKKIATTPFVVGENKSITLTVSIGMACIENDFASIESCINAADNALYEAKHAGRNRLKISEVRAK